MLRWDNGTPIETGDVVSAVWHDIYDDGDNKERDATILEIMPNNNIRVIWGDVVKDDNGRFTKFEGDGTSSILNRYYVRRRHASATELTEHNKVLK